IKIALCVAVLAAVALLWSGYTRISMPSQSETVATGGLAGLLNGAFGIVALPVIIFFFSSPAGAAIRFAASQGSRTAGRSSACRCARAAAGGESGCECGNSQTHRRGWCKIREGSGCRARRPVKDAISVANNFEEETGAKA